MKISIFIMILLVGGSVLAGDPQKYVDEEGHVTYSDKPVPGAVRSETVPVDPAPDPAEVEAARERIEKTEALAEKARQEREAREQEREKARREAEAAKPEVVIIQEESAGGYYPEYYNPPLITPVRPDPGQRPGIGPGRPDHPAYRPPGQRPPLGRPPASIQPVPR